MKYQITIEYCPKCNWMMRAAWIAQELLVTFEEEIDLIGSGTPINGYEVFKIRHVC